MMDEMILALMVLITAGSPLPGDISRVAYLDGFQGPQEQLWAFRQVWVESRFKVTAHNECCYGLMQINLDVWGDGPWRRYHTANLQKGFGYMRELKDKYGDHRKALAAYVWGPGNLDKHLEENKDWFRELPTEVANYVDAIALERVWEWPLWAWWRS